MNSVKLPPPLRRHRLRIATNDAWKVAIALNWSTDHDEGFKVINTTAVATAGFTDTVTVSGGTGVYSLSYIFSLDGVLASSNTSLFQSSFCAIHAADAPNGNTLSGSLSADFGSTVTLEYLLITGSLGNPIPGAQISSTAGVTYSLDPRNTVAVPEPGWLAVGGLLALAGVRRYRRS